MATKNGVNYLYGIDFTDKKDVLVQYVENQVVNDDLSAILAEKTGDEWTRVATGGFSAIDAVIEYNGANDLTSRPTNSRFANVMIIKLGVCCDAVSGRIYLHYN